MSTLEQYVETASRAVGDLAIAAIGFASPVWFGLFSHDAHLLLIIGGIVLLTLRVVVAIFDVRLKLRRWRQPP